MKKTVAIAAVAAAFAAGSAQARDQIQIVGSSTVFPFSTLVAEQFGNKTTFPTPIVESTGSGGGAKLFCAGVGANTPDITNASRRMKSSEFETCVQNGVTDITEAKIGFDGIVIGNSNDGFYGSVSREQLFLALAKEVPVNGELVPNPYSRWSEIDPSLPNTRIEVLGPPPTSGTRDAFEELAMEGGAEDNEFMQALEESDEDRWEEVWSTLREDGAFIEAGENDNLIVQKLVNNPTAVGIFGYSFLLENQDRIHGWQIEGVEPNDQTISDGSYPVSRSMYFYIKNAHIGVIPGIEEYVAEFVSEAAIGPDGYTTEKGLIPLPAAQRDALRRTVENREKLAL